MLVKYFIILLIPALLILGGCGNKTDPAEVLANMNISMSEIKQVKINGQFNLLSNAGQTIFEGLSDLDIIFNSQLDLADAKDFKYSISLLVDGTGPEGSTRLGADIISLFDYNYFRITDIILPLGLPFSLTTDDNWYKVKKVTTSDENILGSNPNLLTNTEVLAIRRLISKTQFFIPLETKPDATVNGFRSHHISVILDEIVLLEFIDQLSNVTNNKLNLDKNIVQYLANDYKYDFWITKKDSKLTKAKINGIYANNNDEIVFDAEINLINFDFIADINAPSKNVEEFKLDNLFGLPLANL